MILELKNIYKSFGEKQVLTGVSFQAEGGKAFGLLGRNGAGKTTSIRILMDVFPANSGEVLITSAKPTSMMFGMVIASCLAGLTQLVAVFGSALVFYNLNKSYWGDK